MQRLEQVTPEEMPEVARVASELFEADREAEERRTDAKDYARAASAAAEEMGLPREYMERAAELVQERRIAHVRRRRRRNMGLLAGLGALIAVWGGGRVVVHRAPPAATTYSLLNTAAFPWHLDTNAETRASVSRQNVDAREAAVLRVDSFARNGTGAYWANLTTGFRPRDLSGYQHITFQVRGTGLRTVRLFLEAGPDERWRSQPISLTPRWQEHRLALDSFDHQTKLGNHWQRVNYTAPGQVERFSFKVGDYMNDISAKGEVAVTTLELDPR